MRWREVHQWLGLLREAALPDGLSEAGAQAALDLALDELNQSSLGAAAEIIGEPFANAVLVAAGTVFTAPIEWCAVLLGRGTAVTIKHSRSHPGFALAMASAAKQVGLPLKATSSKEAIASGDIVIAMGSDETIELIGNQLSPPSRFLGFGHRFSLAWIGTDDKPNWNNLAFDTAIHDGRGCMSPVALFTPLPLDIACAGLAAAMESAEAKWPLGAVAPGESAAIRSREALARVTGTLLKGPGWSIHGLPARYFSPMALPRSLAVYHLPNEAAAKKILTSRLKWLSTVGTDSPSASWFDARVCPL